LGKKNSRKGMQRGIRRFSRADEPFSDPKMVKQFEGATKAFKEQVKKRQY